nr:LysR family transcriptional regulator [uncultured Roseateles sp.]
MKIENLFELQVFIEAVNGGSLTAASKVLLMTPAAASASLKKLESRLGVRLVERSTRALRLTPEGQGFMGYAQRALELLQEGEAQLGEDVSRLRGSIRVTTSSDLGRHVMLPLIDEFLELHPGVELLMTASDAPQDLLRDQMDLALRYGELDDSSLVARRLLDLRRVLVAAPVYLERRGMPQTPQELTQHDCLTLKIRNRRETSWRLWANETPDSNPLQLRISGRRSADDAEIAHRWALAGYGVLLKSELDVRDSLARGALVRVLPGYVGDRTPLNAVMPSKRFLPMRVRALVEHLARRLAPTPP